MFELGLQVLVAVLLAVTIAYAVMLNRRLTRLREGRGEMERLVGELSTAIATAETAIGTLRKTAFEDDEALGRRISEARTMRDEIGFLVDRAETLSARLEEQIAAGRAAAPAAASVATPSAAPADDDGLYGDAADETGDVAAARAARATATAWLRNRRPAGTEAANAGPSPMRALR